EIKIAGWWGRLDQFHLGDRVWVWLYTDRQKQPVAIAMIADELSEQDIHGLGVTLEAREADSLTITPVKGANPSLKAEKAEVDRGADKVALETLETGARVYVQSTSERARLVLSPAAFEARREAQKAALRKCWTDEGLPGTVTFMHIFGGEMDYILDHE